MTTKSGVGVNDPQPNGASNAGPPATQAGAAVVGTGLLASAFDHALLRPLGATVFASGVSNSSETRPEAFAREEALLRQHLAASTGRFVYFSTCSIADTDRAGSAYVVHKERMESLVAARLDHLVLRLPQVVGPTANPHTLTNFLANHIREGRDFPVWANAIRCLVDVEDVAAITMDLLRDPWLSHLHADIAPPETVSMEALVGLMEAALGRKARCNMIDCGGGVAPDPSTMLERGPRLGLKLGPGYTRRLIEKYYGNANAV